jgi:hypothetical protein
MHRERRERLRDDAGRESEGRLGIRHGIPGRRDSRIAVGPQGGYNASRVPEGGPPNTEPGAGKDHCHRTKERFAFSRWSLEASQHRPSESSSLVLVAGEGHSPLFPCFSVSADPWENPIRPSPSPTSRRAQCEGVRSRHLSEPELRSHLEVFVEVRTHRMRALCDSRLHPSGSSPSRRHGGRKATSTSGTDDLSSH